MDRTPPQITTVNERCCGCGACAAACPKSCVSLLEDEFGFLHPSVNKDECVGCLSCDKTCPVLHRKENDKVYGVWWAQSKDGAILGGSSSGGLFRTLADRVIGKGGYVCGAAWDRGCRSVHHVLATNATELAMLQRSKYVQSLISVDVYKSVHDALASNRHVMFTGTACQVSAMNNYLGTLADSPLYLSVEVMCHGVPSPKLWTRWLDYVGDCADSEIDAVNFRSKSTGWLTYSVEYYSGDNLVRTTPFTDDWYFEAFQSNASLRSSCFTCPSKRSCGSDITLGDFWGFQNLHPEKDCRSGISAVLCNTARGKEAFEEILSSVECGESSIEDVYKQNRNLKDSSKPHPQRGSFLSEAVKAVQFGEILNSWKFGLTRVGRMRRKLGNVKRKVAGKLQRLHSE